MAKASLKFSDLLQQAQHEPIWVMNTTKAENRGNVFFTVPNNTGTKEDPVNVFVTWTPICLTEEVTRKQLLDSSQFRRAVNQGLLKLISSEEAQEIMESGGAREEAERVRRLSVNSATAEVQYGLGKESDKIEAVDLNGISNPVQQFVELMEMSQDGEGLNTLRTMGELTLKEYRFIVKKAKALNYEGIGKYAVAEIAKLKAGDDE